MLVRVSVAVIVAPGIAAPLCAVTFPSTVPTATCAVVWAGAKRIPSTASVEITRSRKRVPVIALLLVGLNTATLAHRADPAPHSAPIRRSGQRHSFFCTRQYRGDRRRNPVQFQWDSATASQRFEVGSL